MTKLYFGINYNIIDLYFLESSTTFKQQNEAYKYQIDELINDKKQRDAQLDDFSIQLDSKVDDLKVKRKIFF